MREGGREGREKWGGVHVGGKMEGRQLVSKNHQRELSRFLSFVCARACVMLLKTVSWYISLNVIIYV